MKIVFFGTGSFGIPCLESLINSEHQVLTVVTTHDKPSGRNLALRPSPVKEWALARSMPLFDFSKINSDDSLSRLRQLNADVFVVVDFGLIFKKEILEIPKLMPINIHPSLLPKYRGAAPMQWAIINGDRETGVSIVKVIEKLDSGEILMQENLPTSPDEDILTLEKRLSVFGAKMLLEALGKLQAGAAILTPQNEPLATYARKLTKEDGCIHWDRPGVQILNQVRGMSQWPGCYFFYKDKRIIVLQVEIGELEGSKPSQAGTILKADPKQGLWIACLDGVVEVKVVKPEGKKPMSAREFLNGFAIPSGQILE